MARAALGFERRRNRGFTKDRLMTWDGNAGHCCPLGAATLDGQPLLTLQNRRHRGYRRAWYFAIPLGAGAALKAIVCACPAYTYIFFFFRARRCCLQLVSGPYGLSQFAKAVREVLLAVPARPLLVRA